MNLDNMGGSSLNDRQMGPSGNAPQGSISPAIVEEGGPTTQFPEASGSGLHAGASTTDQMQRAVMLNHMANV